GRRARAGFRSVSPPGHPDVALAALELGRTETARGRLDEAVPLLREAVATRTAVFGAASWKTAEAQIALASALAAPAASGRDRPGRAGARALTEEALPIRRRARAPESRLGREAARVEAQIDGGGNGR